MKQKLIQEQKQELPEGWKWSTLGEECNLKIGGTPPRGNSEYFKGSNLWVSVSDLNRGIVDDTREKITDDALNNSNVKLVKKGTVLICFKLSLGKKGIAGKDLYTNEAIAALEVKPESQLTNEFLFYYFDRINLFDYSNTAAKGNCLNKDILATVKIIVPKRSDQIKIVAKLDKQMVQIGIMKKAAENKFNSSQILFKSYLEKIFGDEADKGTKQLTSGIKFMVSGISRPFQSQDIGIPVLRSNNVTWGEVNFENLRFWYNPDDRGTNYEDIILQKGDVLVNFVNGSAKELGKTAVFNGYNRDIIITTNFWRVVFDTSKIIPEYFQLFSMTEKYIRQINKKGKFQGPGSFNQTDFKTIEIPISSISRQQEIIKMANNLKSIALTLIEESNKCLISTNKLSSSILNELFGKYGSSGVENGE